MDTLFWIIAILASMCLFVAIYFANIRRNYLVGYFCIAISMILINFGWIALFADSYSK